MEGEWFENCGYFYEIPFCRCCSELFFRRTHVGMKIDSKFYTIIFKNRIELVSDPIYIHFR